MAIITPFTSDTGQQPGLTYGGMPPELQQEAAQIARRRAITEAMMGQALTPIQQQQVSGRVVPIGLGEGLSKIAQAYLVGKNMKKSDEASMGLVGKYRTGLQNVMDAYTKQREGQLKPPEELMSQQDQPEWDPGTSASAFAQKPDPRGAITSALSSGYGPAHELAKSDLAQLEKSTLTQKDILGEKGYEPRSRLVAAQIMAEGGTPAMALKALSPMGVSPDTQFTQGQENARAIMAENSRQYRHATPSGGALLTDARMRELNGLIGSGQEATLNPIIEANAKLLADGKAAMSGWGSNSPLGRRIVARALEMNPNLDMATYPTRLKARESFVGKNGDLVRSIGVANDHLDTFMEYAAALKNGSNPILINRLSTRLKEEFGHSAPTNLDAVKQVLEKEVVKAIVAGGGGVGEREEVGKTFGRQKSLEQLSGAVGAYRKLFGGQLAGLKRQYEFGTKMTDFEDMLSPTSRAQMPKTPVSTTGPNIDLLQQADRILQGSKE